MFDYIKFMATAFPTEKPVWTTNNEIVLEHPAFLLRCFRKGPGSPTLVVPPQAGHSSHIADYDVNQSLVETTLKNQLVKGELILFGAPVDPSKITCKIAMVASADDDITSEEQLFTAGDHVSSKEQLKITIPDCGHIGGFMGRKSQKYLAEAIGWIDGKANPYAPEINHGHDLYVDGVAPDQSFYND